MKLSIAKIAKKPKANAKGGRVFTVSMKQVPVITAEDRLRLEAAAKRRNDKRRYPVLIEA